MTEERRAKRLEYMRVYSRKRDLMRFYGMTPEQYDEMLEAQNGVCAICARPPSTFRLHVDHDHETGKVRGILCHNCNRALGFLQDSPDTLRRAVRYLEGALS